MRILSAHLVLISLVDYNAELPYWNEKVGPLLEQAGLRKPLNKNGDGGA